MRKPISQREARKLENRVAYLEAIIRNTQNTYALDYPGGTNIVTDECVAEKVTACIRTARLLHHEVVVRLRGNNVVYYAAPHPDARI